MAISSVQLLWKPWGHLWHFAPYIQFSTYPLISTFNIYSTVWPLLPLPLLLPPCYQPPSPLSCWLLQGPPYWISCSDPHFSIVNSPHSKQNELIKIYQFTLRLKILQGLPISEWKSPYNSLHNRFCSYKLLILSQPQQPSCCSFNKPGTVSPQELSTASFLCLKHSSSSLSLDVTFSKRYTLTSLLHITNSIPCLQYFQYTSPSPTCFPFP